MSQSPLTFTTKPWCLFDNGPSCDVPNALLLDNSVGIVVAHDLEQVPKAIEELQSAINAGLYAAGFFSYELGYAFEPGLRKLMPESRRVPLIWFALFSRVEPLAGRQLDGFFNSWLKQHQRDEAGLGRTQIERQEAGYLQDFAKVKALIAAGDIYQVNLAFKMDFEYEGSPLALYHKLRQRQPVSYGAYLEGPDFSVLSLSPELFFEISKRQILTRPMKGTARRGRTRDEDGRLSRALQEDAKNRAENLMIVDLMRNDLSRICEIGSVQVEDLYHITTYPTLHQMTSDVKGRLREDVELFDILKALIPAGSITGAPKMRAQEIIHQFEGDPRGVYCGAIGLLNLDESGQLSARFNVAIRTLTLFQNGEGEAGIGSGVVQDSVGTDEYEECLLKAKFMMTPDFKLIETMRLDSDGQFYLLERHLKRLLRSSELLGFSCSLQECRVALESYAKSLQKSTFLVRLLHSQGGQIELTSMSIAPPDPAKTIRFTISDIPVKSADELLGHKTTRRQLFDDEWQRANKQQGADEILFLNERGELTEGSRTNLFIEREGKMLTPPLSCGLLPGTLREELIEEGRCVEAVLTLKDLESADRIYLGNSVRGLQPALPVGV